ncbi:MAG: glycosyltransferase family 4 protein [Pseudomonadota bacterium]
MKTILQIIPQLNTGGAEISTLEITQALVQAGARALVASEGGRLQNEIAALGGELVIMPVATKNPVQIWQNTNALKHLIKKENIALVHARSRAPAWSAKWAAQQTHTPFVTTYHGAYSNKGPFKNLYNSIMARGDCVIANSEFTADLVRSQHKIDENKLRVIHRGVDTEKFDRNTISQQRLAHLREQWDIDQNQKIVLNAARLTRWKGQHTLIEAVHHLAQDMPLEQTVFILAGDAQGRVDYENSLKQRIQDYELQNHIRLVGHCDDIAAACALADIAVVSSTKPEAFGRAAVEAQALGCPVVVTEIGATAETVLSFPHVSKEKRTGWRIPPDDSSALYHALKEALGLSEAERNILGANAIAHVRQKFTLKQMQYKTLRSYDELLETHFATYFEDFYQAEI